MHSMGFQKDPGTKGTLCTIMFVIMVCEEFQFMQCIHAYNVHECMGVTIAKIYSLVRILYDYWGSILLQ